MWKRHRSHLWTLNFYSALLLASVQCHVLAFGLLSVPSALAEDSTYQCNPSGFTIGIPPIHTAHDVDVRSNLETSPLDLRKLQDILGDVFSKSGLFSNVIILPDAPRPDSADLSLLVSIPLLRQIVTREEPVYEIGISVLLVENLGGRAVFQQTYAEQIRGWFSAGLPPGRRPSTAVELNFRSIALKILREIDPILNGYESSESADPSHVRTVTHSSLDPLYIVPTIVVGPMAGLGDYSRYVEENLRERLERKNCFRIDTLPDPNVQCIRDSFARMQDEPPGSLSSCVPDSGWKGLMLVSWLSAVGDSLRIRSFLMVVPGAEVLYDKSLTTVAGWRLGNTLEQHAAGIAQASHGHPH